MLISALPPTSSSRLGRSTPPPGLGLVPPDDFVAGARSEAQGAPPVAQADHGQTFEVKGLKKAVLATSLALSAVAGFGGTAGAATLPAAQAMDQQVRNENDLAVSVLPQGTPRLDLIRESHPGPGGGDSFQRQEIKEEYSPVGVSLGEGLFQDVHGNLSVVPFLSYGWDLAAQNFQRVDLGDKGQAVQRFGTTVQFTESATKRDIFTERGRQIDLQSPEGKTHFERLEDGSVHVQGPHQLDYTVKKDGLYLKVQRPGQPDISVLRSGDEIRVLENNQITGAASLKDGQMVVKSADGEATVTRSQDGIITEIHGSHGLKDARIVRDGNLFLGRKDSDRMSVDDKQMLAESRQRYEQVMAQLEQVEPGFAKNHPVVASVLEYASANPRLLTKNGGGTGFLQAGTLLATAGTGAETVTALSAEAVALNLANSARALGAAALSAQAAAQAQAAAGNMAQAAQLAQEAQSLGAKAHQAQNQAIQTGQKALKTANVARVMAGAAGALEIVDGGLGIKGGKTDRSLVQGAMAVTQARMEQLTAGMQGQDKAEADADYAKVMNVLTELNKQADKKVRVGGMKIGVGALMVVSALLGPEAPPIVGAIGIAATAGTTVYEHWGPIKSFLTGESDKVPTFLDILPKEDEVVIHLEGIPAKK